MRAVKFHNGVAIICNRKSRRRQPINVSSATLPTKNQPRKVKSKGKLLIKKRVITESPKTCLHILKEKENKKTKKSVNKNSKKRDTPTEDITSNEKKSDKDERNSKVNEKSEGSGKDAFSNHRHGITIVVNKGSVSKVPLLSNEKKKGSDKSINVKPVDKNPPKNDKTDKTPIGDEENHLKRKSSANANKEANKQISKRPTEIIQRHGMPQTQIQNYEPKKSSEKKVIVFSKADKTKNKQQRKIKKMKKKIRQINFRVMCMVEAINKKLLIDNKKALQKKLTTFNEEIRTMNSKNSPKTKQRPFSFHYSIKEKLTRLDNDIRKLNNENVPTGLWKF